MGLLDDAIREHLELKRLRGADPGLVSREEQEAFGPARGEDPADTGDDMAAAEGHAGGEASPTPGGSEQLEGFSNVGQETAELDMRAVLEDASDRPVPAGPPSSDVPQEQGTAEDSLEWEVPGDGMAHDGEQAEDDPSNSESGDEPVEDVLEETPDFLRDTPEQERLWFEQRPPRDFDFDK
jgi:hypothetical protein